MTDALEAKRREWNAAVARVARVDPDERAAAIEAAGILRHELMLLEAEHERDRTGERESDAT